MTPRSARGGGPPDTAPTAVEEIPAVPPGSDRPLWSVMIPTYECAGYLRHALAGVLEQDPGPRSMQIEVVDDASTGDDPEAVVREVGGGRVVFHGQPDNVGHVANFNTCLRRSRGHLVHLLHGDDLVLPGFYDALGGVLVAHPEVGAAFCRDRRIDERGRTLGESKPLRSASGVLDDWLERIAAGQRLQPPAMVVRRAVYEELGGFDPRIGCYGEDWEMWVRIAARHPVWYEPRALAAYRIHGDSLTARGVRTGAHAEDYRRAIDINRAHLPADRADEWSRRASVAFARACMRRGWRALAGGDVQGALAHFREGARTNRSWPVLLEFAEHGARAPAAVLGRVAKGPRSGSASAARTTDA